MMIILYSREPNGTFHFAMVKCVFAKTQNPDIYPNTNSIKISQNTNCWFCLQNSRPNVCIKYADTLNAYYARPLIGIIIIFTAFRNVYIQQTTICLVI